MKTQYWAIALSAALAASIGFSNPANAGWEDRVTISGFGSAVYQTTDSDLYFNGEASEGGINQDGSFQGTWWGLNINSTISDRLTVASQIFGEVNEDFEVEVDWAFAAFKLTDQFTLRAGKIKFPVGLVNEYIDVGYAYPWLSAPHVIYTEATSESPENESPTAPDVTRESYTGVSLLWDLPLGDLTLSSNLFGGFVGLENADQKKLRGLTLNLDWDDKVLLTASAYTGEMQNVSEFITNEEEVDLAEDVEFEDNPMAEMNGKDHSVVLVGVKADLNNVVFYAEASQVDIDDMPSLSSQEWYATIGYRMGSWLPHFTYQEYENDAEVGSDEHTKYNISSVGLRYELMKNTALKLDVAQIDHEVGNGLLSGEIEDDDKIMKYGIGINYVY